MIDDDEDVLLAAKMLLKKYNYQVIIEKNPNKIPFLLNNDTYDVILLDMNFSSIFAANRTSSSSSIINILPSFTGGGV